MRYFHFFPIALLFFIACQPETATKPIDLTAAKNTVTIQLNNFYSAAKVKDIEAYKSFLTDDGLYCGTDPEEFFSKKKLLALSAPMFEDDSLEFNYSIDKREIRVATDGNSAICVDQFIVEWISKKISVRVVSHFIKIGNDWKIDFFSWSLIPKNDDISKLNKALE